MSRLNRIFIKKAVRAVRKLNRTLLEKNCGELERAVESCGELRRLKTELLRAVRSCGEPWKEN